MLQNYNNIPSADLIPQSQTAPDDLVIGSLPKPYDPMQDPNLPHVSFDIRLGKKVQYIDFNYSDYKRSAEALGLTGDDFSKTTVLVRPNHYRNKGGYHKGNKSIDVSLDHNVNTHLVHEMKHAADDSEKKLGYTAVTAMVNLACASNLPTSILFSANNLAGGLLGESGFTGPIGWTFAASYIGTGVYFLRPTEIRARRAAREHRANIITSVGKL